MITNGEFDFIIIPLGNNPPMSSVWCPIHDDILTSERFPLTDSFLASPLKRQVMFSFDVSFFVVCDVMTLMWHLCNDNRLPLHSHGLLSSLLFHISKQILFGEVILYRTMTMNAFFMNVIRRKIYQQILDILAKFIPTQDVLCSLWHLSFHLIVNYENDWHWFVQRKLSLEYTFDDTPHCLNYQHSIQEYKMKVTHFHHSYPSLVGRIHVKILFIVRMMSYERYVHALIYMLAWRNTVSRKSPTEDVKYEAWEA